MTEPKYTSRELYRRLLHYLMPYWRVFLLSVGSMVLIAASEPAFAALLKPMLDGSFVKKDVHTMHLMPLLLLLLFLVRGIASYVNTYTIQWISSKMVMDLRDTAFRQLLALPTTYYDNHSSGGLIANVAFNITQVTEAGFSVITVLVRDSLTVTGLLGWMLYLNWKLTLIALVVAPVIALIIRLVSRRLRTMTRELQRSLGHITHILEESITGHKVVKTFGGQAYESRRYHDAINQSRRYTMKQVSAASANVPIVQLVAAAALAIIIFIATMQSAANETTVGGFVSFLTAMLMLFSPIKRLTSVNEGLQRGLAAAEIFFELLDEDAEVDAGERRLQRAQGEIVFRAVDFSYHPADAPALSGVSLKIAPGETVALVGSSGGGKTSLVNLIPRFYHPNRGEILIDGCNIASIRLADLRANIALVSQEVILFNDTIAANIAYGQYSQAAQADIIAAAEAAHAMDFIREMPNGLQTMIGEKGLRLSGGQRQRIAIARALLKDAPILILDEATSALDSASEQHVQAALETLMKHRTTIIIAHRLSTIEKADRILALQKGRIVEQGAHDELLAKNGVYANLYRIQFATEQ
ncbi:MAG TPA: lipid A export permease/ATP-binding protein MsbA [Betaproteobacteria bacterium]|nr:lipid A export permease/ATP-binding protein MsbA [Betaproteobacteria bacterium]